EHIAADRAHTVAGKDEVYVVWRNFDLGSFGAPVACNQKSINANQDPMIVCSHDGGATFVHKRSAGPGDRPRVTVGADGFVYVTTMDGDSVMVNKLSSCKKGLEQQDGFPVEVADIDEPSCPVPGLDRCYEDQLVSATVATDPDDGDHLAVVYARQSEND